MNYELSDKLKNAIEEEVARLVDFSSMSGEVALGDDFCFTPTQGMHAGFRVNIFSISKGGSKIQVGEKVYTFRAFLWRSGEGRGVSVNQTPGELALKCREARRAGQVVEILGVGEDTENGEGEEK